MSDMTLDQIIQTANHLSPLDGFQFTIEEMQVVITALETAREELEDAVQEARNDGWAMGYEAGQPDE